MQQVEPIAIRAAEAGKLLGVSARVIVNAAKAGKIPARMIGRRFFFSRVALQRWMDEGNDFAPLPPIRYELPARQFRRRGRGVLPR